MKTTTKITAYIVHSIAAMVLVVSAQISLAGSATWLSSPQDSAWENANNWTTGGPPNGPSDTATFAQSSLTDVNISTSEEVNSILFTSDSDSFDFSISGAPLSISGSGIQQNNSVLQTFFAHEAGQIIFNNTSTAGHASITSGTDLMSSFGGTTIFNDSSTAESAILVAAGGTYAYGSGAIVFNDTSSGGTAQVRVTAGYPLNSGTGSLDISHHQSGLTIGSIEGSGNVFLGGNDLTAGTNNIDTAFSGVIYNSGYGGGSLAKVGSGVLSLQTNYCIADTVGLILVSGSVINLDFTGTPDVIASLVIDGVSQPPGIYGGPMSGAPNILPEFSGVGTVQVGPSILGNISTRAFIQTGDNVMIAGFIVQGTESKRVIIRGIGPELRWIYGVPNALGDPTLELHDSTGALIASNDNWQHTIIGGIITSDQVVAIEVSGYAPGYASDSGIIADLPPGNYTAIVRGVANTAGVALAEVYDLNPGPNSTLGNISTRSFVQTGDNVMIGGFIVQGTTPKKAIIRAIGPELTQYGVPNPLNDPTLELYDSTGALIASNDNWMTTIIGGIITSDQVQDILNSGHAPTDPSESAIIATLPAGNYTAIVRGVTGTTGVALVEVYDLD